MQQLTTSEQHMHEREQKIADLEKKVERLSSENVAMNKTLTVRCKVLWCHTRGHDYCCACHSWKLRLQCVLFCVPVRALMPDW